MIQLWNEAIPGFDPGLSDEIPQLIPFVLTKPEKHGAAIVCPGGGYNHRAQHEGGPVAEWLNRIGLSAFVLQYRVAPYRYPVPLLDVKRAIRYVRFHAPEWNIDPEKIVILGFSAGGHLAATAGIHYDLGDPEATDPVDRVSSRPNAMVLCYPVITFGEFGHAGSKQCLLGTSPDPELVKYLSLDENVTSDTPPTFLWHTANDASVPVANTLRMAMALSRAGVPFEAHIFPNGRHGLGLGTNIPEIAVWVDLCEKWLRGLGY